MASKYSINVKNTFLVIYLTGYQCYNFTKLKQKRVLSPTYLTGNIWAIATGSYYINYFTYSNAAWEKKLLKLFLNYPSNFGIKFLPFNPAL